MKKCIVHFILFAIILLGLFDCKRENGGTVVVHVSKVTDITSSTAQCEGEISSEGGMEITSRGVCWSKHPGPTIRDQLTTNGKGIGSFTSSISGLDPANNYYLRAYACWGTEIAYSEEVTFSSFSALPTLSTNPITNITSRTVNCGGNISEDGGGSITERGFCWSTHPNPTIAENKLNNGTGKGDFTGNLTGLSKNTLYYLRSYATNEAGTAYGNEFFFRTWSSDETVSDIEGNIYHTVQIGNQIWMAENLKTTKFRNGDPIPENKTAGIISSAAWCSYINDQNIQKYGRLYDGFTILDSRNVAPVGWHIPTDEEWKTLEDYLGGPAVAGGKLKLDGTNLNGLSDWNSPNSGATNESGFNGLPSGERARWISYSEINGSAYWWSSTLAETGRDIYYRCVNFNHAILIRSYWVFDEFLSIRCIKD